MGTPRDGRKPGSPEVLRYLRLLPRPRNPMQEHQDAPITGSPADPSHDRRARGLGTVLQMLADTGCGIWALQGMGLAFGIFREGRGESLVPLMIGLVFVTLSLSVSGVKRSGLPAWQGWYPGRSPRPTRGALLVLALYLPMLAVAGLTRGDNGFWATRIAGAALMLCCLGTLLYNPGDRRLGTIGGGAGATVPVGRVMSALYGGGLWLWLCAAADSDVAFGPAPPEHQPWLLLLMIMALLLGLMEGMRWHALRMGESGVQRESVPVRGRFVAAVLSHALPCLALLLADRWQASGVLAGVAAASNLAGRALEQGLYSRASARRLAVTSLA